MNTLKEKIFKLYEYSDLLIENGMQEEADRLIADIDAILNSLKEQ